MPSHQGAEGLSTHRLPPPISVATQQGSFACVNRDGRNTILAYFNVKETETQNKEHFNYECDVLTPKFFIFLVLFELQTELLSDTVIPLCSLYARNYLRKTSLKKK